MYSLRAEDTTPQTASQYLSQSAANYPSFRQNYASGIGTEHKKELLLNIFRARAALMCDKYMLHVACGKEVLCAAGLEMLFLMSRGPLFLVLVVRLKMQLYHNWKWTVQQTCLISSFAIVHSWQSEK